MNINQLNDDCLRKVFAYLSLNDILNLEFVCPRWKSIQEQVCEGQTSIKLFGANSNLTSFIANESMHYGQMKCCPLFDSVNDYLLIAKLDSFTCRHLVNKFPNLRMLLIDGCHISKSNVLVFMISQWYNLQCLSLIHLIGDVVWKNVLSCIDSLAHLKHLSLFGVDEELKLPTVLCQLEQFNLGRYEYSLLQVLVQLGIKIRKLGLYDSNCTASCLTQLANANSTIKHQVTHLAIKSDVLKQPQMERNLLTFIHTNLLCLTSVEIYTENGFKMEDILQLRQLINLIEVSFYAAEKSDITSRRSLQDYKFTDQIGSVKVLNLDIDFDSATLEIIVLLFPNVQKASVNFARVCCSCPEFPEIIEVPPLIQNPVPVVNENVPPQPQADAPVGEANRAEPLPAPPIPPEEPQIFEEDNCESCSEKAMLTFSSFKSLHKLSITGARCKDSAVKAMEMCNGLTCVVFASCINYSLKHLLNVCYLMATQRKQQSIQLKINSDKFKKIIKLAKKPNNLFVENVDPIVNEHESL